MSLVRRLKYEPNGLQVNGEAAKTNRILQKGQQVCVQLPMDDCAVDAQEIPLSIVYEDEHVMVLDKPAGLVMHPTRSHKEGTLANGFAHLMQQRGKSQAFRPIGRLDADTSGLVLCAMNRYAAPPLAKSLKKMYVCLVEGALYEDGCVTAPLSNREDSVVIQCVSEFGKESITEYTALATTGEISLLAVRPKTGRTHQIRVHMAHLGHPLLGDGLYGGKQIQMQRHALHCAEISFCMFCDEQKQFVSPLAHDMMRILQEGAWERTEKGEKWWACQNFDIIV